MLHNLRTRGCKVCKVASGADIGNKRVVAILSFLEMKVRQGGALSAAQKRWHREARVLGAAVVTGHGAKQACAEVERVALERWGVELPPVAQALQDKGA
jgi:hypothetical protein